jgi:NAD(P)-dependent dehydrogenase (short-subunit alcohol dehydrogenase family)
MAKRSERTSPRRAATGRATAAAATRPAETTRPLSGRVAIVAGATRGAGRGIARALGEAGATVYCTGRSVKGNPSPYKRPETIEETAELVTAAGGVGIAVRVDHGVDEEVRGLIARVAKEQKRLDILADSVAGEDPTFPWTPAFEKTDATRSLALMDQAVFTHLRTAVHAVPLMKRGRKGGLIVQVTEGDTMSGGVSVVHHLVKTGLKHLAFALADELRKHQIAVVSVTPGFLRSESMLAHFKVTEANWRDGGKKDPNFLHSETPLFLGRGVAALAADPQIFERSGDLLSSWELGRDYALVDADGRRPDWGKQYAELGPTYQWLKDGLRREARWLRTLAARAERYAGPPMAPTGLGHR